MSEIEKDNEELEEKEGHKKKHHFLNFLIFIVVGMTNNFILYHILFSVTDKPSPIS